MSSPLSKAMNFDEMLSCLDDGIKNPKRKSRKGSIAEYLQGIETEIESLILSMVSKASENGRKSRLSTPYSSSLIYNQEVEVVADFGDLFLDFKNTSSELVRLESVCCCVFNCFIVEIEWHGRPPTHEEWDFNSVDLFVIQYSFSPPSR